MASVTTKGFLGSEAQDAADREDQVGLADPIFEIDYIDLIGCHQNARRIGGIHGERGLRCVGKAVSSALVVHRNKVCGELGRAAWKDGGPGGTGISGLKNEIIQVQGIEAADPARVVGVYENLSRLANPALHDIPLHGSCGFLAKDILPDCVGDAVFLGIWRKRYKTRRPAGSRSERSICRSPDRSEVRPDRQRRVRCHWNRRTS